MDGDLGLWSTAISLGTAARRVPRPRLSAFGRDRAGGSSSVTSSRGRLVVPSTNAVGTETISGSALPALRNLQLLPPRSPTGLPRSTSHLRANSGADTPVVRTLGNRLR